MASTSNIEVATVGSEKNEDLPPPQKRRKITKNLASDIHPAQPAAMVIPETTPANETSQSNMSIAIEILPAKLRHLQSKYEFTSMSIISSSKIELKVRNLQRRLEKFSFADTKAKPQVVALHAKAPVVSKMVTIVQIVKRNIENEKGKWWQYSKLHGEIMELNETGKKGREQGKTLLKLQKDQDTVEGSGPVAGDVRVDSVDGDGDDDPTFEIMGAEDSQSGNRKKIRAVPVMTIFMSMVPVKELKDVYGYVNLIKKK